MSGVDFKIFVIGFNKCGTRSLHTYFTECGLNSCHGGVQANLHMAIAINVVRGRPALEGLDGFDAYSDIMSVRTQFRHLDRDYPGSRFIHNVRDPDRWIVSRLNHLGGRYVEFLNIYHEVDLSWTDWVAKWRRDLAAHERAVADHFRLRPLDLLRLDIEQDSLAALAGFLGIPAPARSASSLPRVGVTGRKHKRYILEGGQIIKRDP